MHSFALIVIFVPITVQYKEGAGIRKQHWEHDMREFILRLNYKKEIQSVQIDRSSNYCNKSKRVFPFPDSGKWSLRRWRATGWHLPNRSHILARVPSGLQPLEDPVHLVTGQQLGAVSQRSPECCEVALESRPGMLLEASLQWPCHLLGAWLCVKSCHRALVTWWLTKLLTQLLWCNPVSQSSDFRAPLFCHPSLRNAPGSTRVPHLAA